MEYIELPGDDRSAFEAAYPEVLSAFVCQDLETLDVDGLPAGVRVVSLDYVNGLPQTVKKTSSHRVADGEGYTDQGLRFGQGWVERVAGRATGILEIQARLPDLEHAQEQMGTAGPTSSRTWASMNPSASSSRHVTVPELESRSSAQNAPCRLSRTPSTGRAARNGSSTSPTSLSSVARLTGPPVRAFA